MWYRILLCIWAVLLVLDIPWVMLNTKIGIYAGWVNGTVSNRVAVSGLWLVISFLLAMMLTAILFYVPRDKAVMLCIFFGFTVYFVFNATSLVMFKWSIFSAIGDTMWGAMLCGAAGAVGWALMQKWRTVDPAIVNPAAL